MIPDNHIICNFRECAVKFNDYFEFPRELDMEPYTVQGLAKIEGR
jgi:ubiquitin carboxyl-terminal hydrolase 9/24